LRTKFEQIRRENEQADEFSKLTVEELCVDPDYIEMLHRRVEEDVEETRKELEWD
jgi:protoheme ferro-lyase